LSALPPVVVSGFRTSRRSYPHLVDEDDRAARALIDPVSLRSACSSAAPEGRRGCRHLALDLGSRHHAATESMTSTSMRSSARAINDLERCSPVSGCDTITVDVDAHFLA